MTLSVLIPTLPERYQLLKRLQNILTSQVARYSDRVVIHYNDAGRHATIGEKRNALMERVTTDYSVFIDDDDIVSFNYIDSIMRAMESNPDCITFNGWMTTNGMNRRDFIIKLGEKYEERRGVYYRFPNHIVPMKTSLVRHIKFPHITQTEDYQWARQINDKKLLKTSVHIEQDLYIYDFRTNKPPYGYRVR